MKLVEAQAKLPKQKKHARKPQKYKARAAGAAVVAASSRSPKSQTKELVPQPQVKKRSLIPKLGPITRVRAAARAEVPDHPAPSPSLDQQTVNAEDVVRKQFRSRFSIFKSQPRKSNIDIALERLHETTHNEEKYPQQALVPPTRERGDTLKAIQARAEQANRLVSEMEEAQEDASRLASEAREAAEKVSNAVAIVSKIETQEQVQKLLSDHEEFMQEDSDKVKDLKPEPNEWGISHQGPTNKTFMDRMQIHRNKANYNVTERRKRQQEAEMKHCTFKPYTLNEIAELSDDKIENE